MTEKILLSVEISKINKILLDKIQEKEWMDAEYIIEKWIQLYDAYFIKKNINNFEDTKIEDMKCPHDNMILKSVNSWWLKFYWCDQCKWFLVSVHEYENVLKKFDKEFVKYDLNKTKLICPSCNRNMSVMNHMSKEIDICNHCWHIWYDAWEFQKIIDLLKYLK